MVVYKHYQFVTCITTMNIEAKQQYMETLREKYLKANKQGKGKILDEYCENIGQERKYVSKKFRYKVKLKERRKQRKEYYDSSVKVVLAEIWKIFDYPCGQRLKFLLETETERLRKFGEITCSDEVSGKLVKIGSATIDRKLKYEKEVLLFNLRYKKKRDMTLLNQVPIKTSADLGNKKSGNIGIDCVEHCGMSASGEYVNSLTTVDIHFGWWEGEALMGKGQERALRGMDNCRLRFPVKWKEMHPDNGTNILNWSVYKYAEDNNIALSRSRPYQKNDNCFVEQKNSTHVRKPFGYLRFDTQEEMQIMNDLYRNELRLFKNFFQPVMKLERKVRLKGKIHRKYDKALTPYQRILNSDQVDCGTKKELRSVYEGLNPALLKRSIDTKIKKLYEVYKLKNNSRNVAVDKRLTASLVSYYMIQQL